MKIPADKVLLSTGAVLRWRLVCEAAATDLKNRGYVWAPNEIGTEYIEMIDGCMIVSVDIPIGTIRMPLACEEWEWRQVEPSVN